MSPGRAERYRRLYSLSLGRWLFLATFFLLFVAVLLILHIRSVDAEYRNDEKMAAAFAKTEGGLTDIEETVFYTWKESMWIVRGRDKDNTDWMLWERKEGLVKEKVSDGYSEERIRERFAAERPSADPVRVLPGWFMNEPAWEIRYAKTPRSAEQAIDFYSFKEGKLIKTYELPG